MNALQSRLISEIRVDLSIQERDIHVRIPVKIQILAVREILEGLRLHIRPGQNTDLSAVERLVTCRLLNAAALFFARQPVKNDGKNRQHGKNAEYDDINLFCLFHR